MKKNSSKLRAPMAGIKSWVMNLQGDVISPRLQGIDMSTS